MGTGKTGAFDQGLQFGPDHIRGHLPGADICPKTTIDTGNDAAAVAHGVDDLLDTLSYHFGMLDKIGRRVDNSGQQEHGVRQGIALEEPVLMLVAGVGQFD
jgi:hypothetical protein